MGIFGNSKKDNVFFAQFPDGSKVESKADLDRLLSDFSFSPSTLEDWRLEKSDIEAIAKASAALFAIGIPSDESIIAFGPVSLTQFPKDHNEYIADAVLTVHRLFIYFQKSLLKPDYLILALENITGLTSTGSWSADFSFNNGIHIDKSGAFEMATVYFGLGERMGKDGHANRRSVTLMTSLSKTLNEIHLK